MVFIREPLHSDLCCSCHSHLQSVKTATAFREHDIVVQGCPWVGSSCACTGVLMCILMRWSRGSHTGAHQHSCRVCYTQMGVGSGVGWGGWCVWSVPEMEPRASDAIGLGWDLRILLLCAGLQKWLSPHSWQFNKHVRPLVTAIILIQVYAYPQGQQMLL